MSSQKRIASQILKCGVSRVRVKAGKEVEEALTREDVRNLIRKGFIWKEQKKGTSKFNVKRKVRQKKRGRMRGHGSRKGTSGARKPRKEIWVESVRPLRRLLRELKDAGSIDNRVYRKIYVMIKGGAFRNKKHLLYYLKDHELMKAKKTESKKSRKIKTESRKKEPKRKVAKK
jgi:large subunit ribosomal protein L19e